MYVIHKYVFLTLALQLKINKKPQTKHLLQYGLQSSTASLIYLLVFFPLYLYLSSSQIHNMSYLVKLPS